MPRGHPGIVKQTGDKQKRPRGNPNLKAGPGRPKGVPNKMTRDLKEAIIEAACTAHPDGLVAYLRLQAQADMPSPFMSLLGRVLPHVLAGDPNAPVGIDIRWRDD